MVDKRGQIDHEKRQIEAMNYFSENSMIYFLEKQLNNMFFDKPPDPFAYMVRKFDRG